LARGWFFPLPGVCLAAISELLKAEETDMRFSVKPHHRDTEATSCKVRIDHEIASLPSR
jgi:hypothetical protein